MDHPNVIKLLHTEEDQYFKFYALELCAASMDEIFPVEHPKYKGPLPSDLDVLLQLSKGLRYIHDNGFVHRDIKPGNVLISYPNDDGMAVVMKWADFGLCKPISSRGSFSVSGMRGTFNWIAPEILAILQEEQPSEGSRGTVESDTWSAGCVFFKYLTKGKHPFGEKNIDANILNDKAINLTGLQSDHFAFNLIREMIKKEPENRMKLSDVVEILIRVKEETSNQRKKYQDYSIIRELEAGQLYSWNQWNLALKDGQLFVWSDDVAIEDILPPWRNLKIKLNESDKMKVAALKKDGSLESDKEGSEEPAREEGALNREMLEMVGITPGIPSRSPLNIHFVSSDGMEWRIYPSEQGDKLSISNATRAIILFGPAFLSTFHVTERDDGIVRIMTDRAKEEMERELLELCSLPSPEKKDLDRIAGLLRAGVDVNCTSRRGETPLLLCLQNQSGDSCLGCLEVLLEGNQSSDGGGSPALHALCHRNADARESENIVHIMKFLIQKSVIDVDSKDNIGWTVLHWLCVNYKKENIVDVMELLIEKGANVKLEDRDGRTALHLLCENYTNENFVDAMRLLIHKGVNINLKENNGRTALHYLCWKYKNDNIVEVMKILIDHGIDVDSRDKNGWSALHYVCRFCANGNIVNVMRFLIENGIHENLQDVLGRTALHLLCENYEGGNIVDAMQLLLYRLVDVKWTDDLGRSALHHLCKASKNEGMMLDAMRFLVEKGVHLINLKDNLGRTACHWLCESYRNGNIIEAMDLLINERFDANLKDEWGRTVLHCLCQNDKNDHIAIAIKEFLLKNQHVDVTLQDLDGRTVLHYLCQNYKEDSVDVITLLIMKGIDVKLVDQWGRTALHYLCKNKNKSIDRAKELLIKNGVDINLIDRNGKTALDYLKE